MSESGINPEAMRRVDEEQVALLRAGRIFAGKGKRNRYTCGECGASVVTVDTDAGVTPFMMSCGVATAEAGRATLCSGGMSSAFYRDSTAYDGAAELEWYRPRTDEEIAQVLEQGVDPEHLLQGGLARRAFVKPINVPFSDPSKDYRPVRYG